MPIRSPTTALATIALTLAAHGDLHAQAAARGVDGYVPPVPTPASFVHDGAGVLASGERDAIDARIRAVQTAGRGDVGVAILPTIGDHEPYEVGVAIYRAWKIGRVAEIGSAERGLGVLILIVPKEVEPQGRGQCWIATGTGAEGPLTDLAAGRICRETIIPLLKERAHGRAILAGVAAIDAELAEDPALADGAPASDAGGESGAGCRSGCSRCSAASASRAPACPCGCAGAGAARAPARSAAT
jgi:uncharacterized membrane protein YgcG